MGLEYITQVKNFQSTLHPFETSTNSNEQNIANMSSDIEYSNKYKDEDFEYRHVTLPRQFAGQLPTNRCMTEKEWRALGVQQSRGWKQYAIHKPEPHVLLFRRPIGTNSQTGKAPASWKPPKGISQDDVRFWRTGVA